MRHKKHIKDELALLKTKKVSNNSIFEGRERVYYKRNKYSIHDIGSSEFLNKIAFTLDFDSHILLLIFVALSDNKEVTDFDGDKEEALNKIIKGTYQSERHKGKPFEANEYKRYFELCRPYYEFIPIYIQSVLKEMEKGNMYRHIYIPEDINKEIQKADNYLIDLLNQRKIFKYAKHINEGKYGTDEYYIKELDNLGAVKEQFKVATKGINENELRATVYRRYNSIVGNWLIDYNNTHFDSFTGDIKIKVSNSLETHFLEFNLKDYKYTPENPLSHVNENSIIYLVMNTLGKKVPIKDKHIYYNIVKGYLKNKGIIMDIDYDNEIDKCLTITDMNDGKYNYIIESKKTDEKSKENIFQYLYDAFLIYEKVINNTDVVLFRDLSMFITVPDKKKVKPSDLLVPNKMLFRKLKELSLSESENFLRMRDLLNKKMPHLYNEVYINKLFEDDFLKVEDMTVIEHIIEEIRDAIEWSNELKFSDFRKIVHYIDVDAPQRQKFEGRPLSYTYRDYIRFVGGLVDGGFRTKESVNFTPYSIKLEHDIANSEYHMVRKIIQSDRLKQIYEESTELDIILDKTYKCDGEDIIFLKADTPDKLREEGKQLSHCVGSYVDNILRGSCMILFARKKEDPDTSWFTVELRNTSHGYALGQTQSHIEYSLPKDLEEELLKDIKEINKEKGKQSA